MGWSGGVGRRTYDMSESIYSLHVAAWLGFQAKVNERVTYRAKVGGLLIRDSAEQFGGGGFLGGESKVGSFLAGLDLWITSGVNVVVRAGFAF